MLSVNLELGIFSASSCTKPETFRICVGNFAAMSTTAISPYWSWSIVLWPQQRWHLRFSAVTSCSKPDFEAPNANNVLLLRQAQLSSFMQMKSAISHLQKKVSASSIILPNYNKCKGFPLISPCLPISMEDCNFMQSLLETNESTKRNSSWIKSSKRICTNIFYELNWIHYKCTTPCEKGRFICISFPFRVASVGIFSENVFLQMKLLVSDMSARRWRGPEDGATPMPIRSGSTARVQKILSRCGRNHHWFKADWLSTFREWQASYIFIQPQNRADTFFQNWVWLQMYCLTAFLPGDKPSLSTWNSPGPTSRRTLGCPELETRQCYPIKVKILSAIKYDRHVEQR